MRFLILLCLTAPAWASTDIQYNPCEFNWVRNLPCENIPPATPFHITVAQPNTIHTNAFAPPNWGTSAAEVHTNFAQALYDDFARNTAIKSQFEATQAVTIALLSQYMAANDPIGADTWDMLYEAARSLTAADLVRLEASFGPNVDSAVEAGAPPAVAQAYFAAGTPSPTPGGWWWSTIPGNVFTPLPSDQYIYLIYLAQYFSDNDANPLRSMRRATLFVQARMKLGVIDVISIAGSIAGFVSLFDPNAIADLNNFVQSYKGGWANLISTSPGAPMILPGYPTLMPSVNPLPPDFNPDSPTLPAIDDSPDAYGFCTDAILGC